MTFSLYFREKEKRKESNTQILGLCTQGSLGRGPFYQFEPGYQTLVKKGEQFERVKYRFYNVYLSIYLMYLLNYDFELLKRLIFFLYKITFYKLFISFYFYFSGYQDRRYFQTIIKPKKRRSKNLHEHHPHSCTSLIL